MSAAKRSPKRFSGPVIVLPKSVFRSPEYWTLSHRARTLLLAFHLDFNSHNNGALRLLFTKPAAFGFSGRAQMELARNELLTAGWIEITRQGGKHSPSLYALTWMPINACDADGIKSRAVSHLWKAEKVGDRDTFGKAAPAKCQRKPPAKQNLIPPIRESDSRITGFRPVSDSRIRGLSGRFPSIFDSRIRGRSHISHVCAERREGAAR